MSCRRNFRLFWLVCAFFNYCFVNVLLYDLLTGNIVVACAKPSLILLSSMCVCMLNVYARGFLHRALHAPTLPVDFCYVTHSPSHNVTYHKSASTYKTHIVRVHCFIVSSLQLMFFPPSSVLGPCTAPCFSYTLHPLLAHLHTIMRPPLWTPLSFGGNAVTS